MKTIQLLFLLPLMGILLSASCKKENLNALPPATTTGENTMGGYIDGKLFVSRRRDLLSTDPSITYNTVLSKLTFGGNSVLIPDGPVVGFSLEENLKQGKLILTPGGKNSGLLTIRAASGTLIHYFSQSGYVELTRFDPNAKIFSGTFDVVFKSESGQTVHFTEGRFDLQSF
ncbi:MAG TPA: hypothetical protein VNI52_08640 [Sphingobacteriaceae bacterium]|nr:hypothetical protein [Sphingobacteriaceae bacterium]